ncbi:hypothetical protein ANCCAN_20663 [Ancylostoma caninum]|uniref:Uncharacterized protein n=1 Tax=Ancylostoma caninum TaxID=29170 RepID=A0A368FPQ0_ANCCA|nr:hypothetical protein ANCCAN_20663 [Ancylostoma caninum]
MKTFTNWCWYAARVASYSAKAILFDSSRPNGAGGTVGFLRWPSSYATGPQAPRYTAIPVKAHPLLNARFMKPIDVPSLKCKKCNCCLLGRVGPFGSLEPGGRDCCDCRRCPNTPTDSYVAPPSQPGYPTLPPIPLPLPQPPVVVPPSYVTSPPRPVFPTIAPPPSPVVPGYPVAPPMKPMYPQPGGHVIPPQSDKCGPGKWSECCFTFCYG